MVTYQELMDLRLGKLDSASTAWEQTVQKMRKVTSGGGDGVSAHELQQKAQAADWKGQNATVTKEFVTKSAREFDDVLTSSRSVHNILSSAQAQFKKHKADAETISTEATKKNILVNTDGSVIAVSPAPTAVGGDNQAPKATQKEVDAVADKVKRVVWEACETDRIAARALRAIAEDPYNFSKTSYADIADADKQQGVEDADAMVALAAKKDSMSDDELRRFTDVMRNQRDNPAFAERFATKMGPDGTLQLWRSLSDPADPEPPGGDRSKLLGDFQNNLSMTLATASHGDSPEMQQWKQGIISAGPKDFGIEGNQVKPYGFQVMSNLMGQGKFDKDFLKAYGDSLYDFEREGSQHPFNTEYLWNNPLRGPVDLDHAGGGADDLGIDPMTGFLNAAAHNPEYATELFNDDDKADYLLKDREYFSEADEYDGGYEEGDPLESRGALGKALFAGGSGIDPDDPQGTFVEHTAAHKQVMAGALERLAGEGNDFPPELRDDMANLLGNHGDDAHRTMSNPLGDGPMNRDQLLEVSKQISRNQDSYALLNEQMNHAMLHDINTETAHPEDSLDRSGRTVGFLEEARYQSITDEKDGDIRDASWKRAWTNATVGTALGYVPHAGPVLSAGTGLIMQGVYEDEVARAGMEASGANQEANEGREKQLHALADQWYQRNSEWANNPAHDGYSKEHGVYSHIGASANDGKADAREDAGDQ